MKSWRNAKRVSSIALAEEERSPILDAPALEA